MPIKGQSKTTEKSTRTVLIGKRTRTDIEPGKCSFSNFEVSKKLINLLRHSQNVHREEDGAVQFWRIKENLQKYFLYCPHWSDSKWKACMAGGGNKKRFQYCTDSSGTIVYLRALQGHSGRNLTDPLLQDNVVIQSNFFQYKYHVGCAFNLHSIISSGFVKGMYPAPHIHEHFMVHKWLRQTAYILTHNLNMLEHTANNGMNTTMHTDANIAQF